MVRRYMEISNWITCVWWPNNIYPPCLLDNTQRSFLLVCNLAALFLLSSSLLLDPTLSPQAQETVVWRPTVHFSGTQCMIAVSLWVIGSRWDVGTPLWIHWSHVGFVPELPLADQPVRSIFQPSLLSFIQNQIHTLCARWSLLLSFVLSPTLPSPQRQCCPIFASAVSYSSGPSLKSHLKDPGCRWICCLWSV